jgi:hypothetical protein
MIESDDLMKHPLLPEFVKNHPDCCASRGRWQFWEDLVTRCLVQQGCRVENWRSTDSDSFGPLVREVTVDGRTYTYG